MKYRLKLLVVFLLTVPLTSLQAKESEELQFPYLITRHDLRAELDPEQSYLSAYDRISLKRQLKKPDYLELLLRKGLTVNGVSVASQQLEFSVSDVADPLHFEVTVDSEDVSYYGRAQVLTITIPEEIGKQKEIILDVSYEGIVRDSLENGDFSREYITEEITGIISPGGVYLGPEAIFYPALAGQLFSVTVEVTLPEEFQSVSEGASRRTVLHEGKRVESRVCDHPLDSFHLVAGKYQVNTVQHAGVDVSTYFFPEESDLSQRYIEACKGYLDLYNGLLGPYAFEKFAVVDNFFATGYGMPSFTLLGSQVLRLPWIVTTSLGHEVCHNWWGNSVYVDYSAGNWCEGLTTYCADYLCKERQSAEDAREYRMGIDKDYTAYTHQENDFPLKDFRERHNPAQRAVGYGKSAMVFHMIRHSCGDEAFWRALQRIYREKIWTYASWNDFQKAFEKEAAKKLGWFFEQWVDRTGAPFLSIATPEKKQTESGWELTFDLDQMQEGEPYVLDVPIRVLGVSQQASFIERVKRGEHSIKLKTSFEPLSFSVDPDFDLFRRLATQEIAPSLAEILGAKKLTIVLPTQVSSDMQDAYRTLAEQLNRQGRFQVFSDNELNPRQLKDEVILFLGTPAQNRAVPTDWVLNDHWAIQDETYRLLGEEYTDPHNALLVVERNPGNAEISFAIFCARTAADILEAGRKLPHYGKYSYLIFSEGRNVAKGSWEVAGSPLTYHF